MRTRQDGAVRRGLGAVVIGLAALAMGSLGGCGTGNANQLMETNRALTDRNQVLTTENETLRAANAQLTDAVDQRDRTISDIKSFVEKLKQENQGLAGQLSAFGDKLRDIKFGQLDPTTDLALKQLASEYPDMIMYDADRGMIRFKSDLTFASGSDQVTEQARKSLETLGSVLQSPSASGYDIKIVGHTDSQPISAGTAKNHRTNWHLSAHRSISVMSELTHMGVSPERLEVAGRGEWQPLVANTGKGNTPQNRRVEIFLVRGNGMATAKGAAPANSKPTKTTKAPETAEDLMK